MAFRMMTRTFALVLTLVVGSALADMALGHGASSVSAFSEHSRHFHGTKDCSRSNFSGGPGSFCSIESSNADLIPVGSNLYYDQPSPIPLTPTGSLLDSNVVLDAGNGNRARGRCTLDFATGLGLCGFSDGTGSFAGFQARFHIDCTSGPVCRVDGTYGFNSLDDER
jgi:hypothetical protein